MLGLAILLLFNLLGYLLNTFCHIPLPPNVLGMILLTLCLSLKIIRLQWIEPAANFLLRHMLLFFVPFLLGIADVFPLLHGNWIALIFGITISSLLTLAVTGFIAQKLSPQSPAPPVLDAP